MILEEIKAIKSDKRDLRNFGITFGVVLGLLAGLLWWKGKDTYTIFVMLSLAFFSLGFLLPAILKPLQKAWMVFAVILGFFMTRVILSVLFYLVFTSISIIGRFIFKKQFLDVKLDESAESYWVRREPRSFDPKNYERQF